MAYEPIKSETQEQYLKIWTHFSVGHFTREQLAKLFADKWVTLKRHRELEINPADAGPATS